MDLMSGTITINAPAGVDGRGGTAVLNNTGDSTGYVGNLFDTSGFDGPAVRVSQDNVVEGHGAVFGSFYHGARSFTLEVELKPASTWALSNARRDQLYRAFNAMAAAGTIAWTEVGGSLRQVTFRREQPPRGPDKEGHVLLSGICDDPRIYAGSTTTGSGTSFSVTNSGNVDTPPTITLAPSSATVNVVNTTTGGTLTFTDLNGGGVVTLNFKDRTIVQGGVSKAGAISYPASEWWELAPGSNAITITNAGTATFRSAWI